MIGAVILGMGRSGTSAVTGMFAAAGFYVGRPDEVLGPHPSNPPGHFENLGLISVHEEILGRLGATWFSAPAIDDVRTARDWAQPRVRAVLDRLAGEAGKAPLVVKDPRIGVLLDLWAPWLERDLHPVLVVRDPVEIAMSLWRRDGTPVPLGLAGWELHTRGLLEQLEGRVVTVVPHRRLLSDPHLAVAVIGSVAGRLSPEQNAGLDPTVAATALRRELHRNQATERDRRDTLTIRQHELWSWLERQEAGECVLRTPDHLRVTGEAAREGAARERERVTLVSALAAARAQISALQTSLRGLSVALDEERAQLAGHCASLDAELAETRERAEVARLTASLAEAARSEAEASAQLVTGSRSWRLTRPLRASRTVARRYRRPPRSRPPV